KMAIDGESSWTWSGTTAALPALQKGSAPSQRIAALWYATQAFTMDINLADGNGHDVSVYCLDWDGAGRVDTSAILDGVSGAVLDTGTVTGFGSGVYVSWHLTGHVIVQITGAGGAGAGASGVFFDQTAPDR